MPLAVHYIYHMYLEACLYYNYFIYLIFMIAEMVWLCANIFFLQDWVYQENCVFYVKYSNKSAAALILSYFLNPIFMVP